MNKLETAVAAHFWSYDRSTSSIIFVTSFSLKRCMSFNDEVVVSDALALSMWIWKTTQVLGSQNTREKAYHRSIKLIHFFPFLLARLHNIDLLILQGPCLVHVLHHSFRSVTQATGASCEEGDSTVEQTRRRTEHGWTMRRAVRMVLQRLRRLDWICEDGSGKPRSSTTKV